MYYPKHNDSDNDDHTDLDEMINSIKIMILIYIKLKWAIFYLYPNKIDIFYLLKLGYFDIERPIFNLNCPIFD